VPESARRFASSGHISGGGDFTSRPVELHRQKRKVEIFLDGPGVAINVMRDMVTSARRAITSEAGQGGLITSSRRARCAHPGDTGSSVEGSGARMGRALSGLLRSFTKKILDRAW
jgi:hypothetical protein